MKWLMYAVILAALGGLVRSCVHSRADGQIEQLVTEMRAKLPIDLPGDLRVTSIDYADRTLTYRGQFTALHAIDPAQRNAAEAAFRERYCNGDMKIIREQGISVRYEVASKAFGEPDTTTRMGASPSDCP